MCPLSVVGPAKGEPDMNGYELGTGSGAGAGRTVSSSVGRGGVVLVAGSENGRGIGRGSDSGIGGGTAAVADRTPKNRDHEVHAVSGSRGIELSTRLSRIDGSGWISFSSQSTHISSIDQGSENPAEEVMRGDFIASPCHLETPKVDVGSSLHPRVQAEVPMVVPSRAWVDEV